MRVVALVGKSGTGKSYKAVCLAHGKEIDYIIDDGLFIKGNKIIAGRSAKREKTKISAVKRALFTDINHKRSVIEKIERHSPQSILVLGTSEKMVSYICENLEIGSINEMIYINEIASKEEMKIAKECRMNQGKHVIPVPTFELKKDFSGYFVDRLKIFLGKQDEILQISERSVVRPTFSYMGKFTIYDRAIVHMVNHVIKKFPSIYRTNKVRVGNYRSGVIINIELVLKHGFKIPEVTSSLQREVKKEVEHMTSLNIISINIVIKSLQIKY